MDNNITDNMIDRINFKIMIANKHFTGWNDMYTIRMAEIDGMIDMLSIVTGKKYKIANDGLKEVE